MSIFSSFKQDFLCLLRASVTGGSVLGWQELSLDEWNQLYLLVEGQGLVSVAMAELGNLPKTALPDMDLLMEWLGQSNYRETIYQEQLEKSCKFADALAKEDV